MLNKKLDYNLEKIEVIQLSNDAYYNLAFNEPCLDDENVDEIAEFKERFPYGFKFEPDIEFVEDSDLIECKVIPICESSTPYTHYNIVGKWTKYEFYYSQDRKQVNFRYYDMHDGRFIDYGWNDININQFGKPDIRPRKCIFPLWGKSWMRY